MPVVDFVFFPSDVLHSSELPSINIRQNSTSYPDGKLQLVICHKDDSSFYKSTRKIFRTATRLLSAVTPEEGALVGGIADRCIGYWIGNQEKAGEAPIQNKRNDDAIHRRLKTEFGPSDTVQFTVGLDQFGDATMNNEGIALNALKFDSSKTGGDATNVMDSPCDHRKPPSIIFLDLDRLFQSLSLVIHTLQKTEDLVRVHWSLFQKVISSLSIQLHSDTGINSFIHVKSAMLYRAVAELSSSGDLVKPNSRLITRSSIDTYFDSRDCDYSTLKHESPPEDASSSENVIRRLRQVKGASGCPLSLHPIRYIERSAPDGTHQLIEICRFHNFDSERGCLRSKKALLNSNVKGCSLDHEHCHNCARTGHRALECPQQQQKPGGDFFLTENERSLQPMVFTKSEDGRFKITDISRYEESKTVDSNLDYSKITLPSLLVLGGRLRGRTLASSEVLPLSSDANKASPEMYHWRKMPNLLEHRGSHAACSPVGTGLAFVLGGGGVDGNLDSVECFSFGDENTYDRTLPVKRRWHKMSGKLSSPRHAFGSVACIVKESSSHDQMSVTLFSVGGWKYGSVSCESTEKLIFQHPCRGTIANQWEICAPLLKPRRLHSVAASVDGSSIYVFGGFVDERFTTASIEMYDIASNQWRACHELPYGDLNSPLVQAIPDWSSKENSFLIFPFSSSEKENPSSNSYVLRYKPCSNNPFSSIFVSNENGDGQRLHLPLRNWASFSATSSRILSKAYLIGGTIDGKWTARGFELDLLTMTWTELPEMACARRRLAALVVE
ncbi:hypothetical protein HJC23_004668 [Cyclotella cryptica]|uniref:CCHC-type domain-containing protein n=1 Tax=Cyclotella cryptica TaxID=29204 RepID=A0ABD3PK70_9STRA|eukprot:CCRYP_013885-RA/>CCRYP_013885-RA protein AED:0.00 eAED:0.00 QI:198/-1/1/1/-1/1/1/38/782